VLADGSWSEDNSSEDFAPDYDYQAVAHVDRDHWSAEFRIPWTSLRVPHPVPEKLSFIVFRNMPRETRIRMSTAVLGREPPCFLCVAEDLTGIVDLPKTSGLTVTPYSTANFTSVSEAGARDRETKFNAGVDVKWRPSSEWVVDATLRPDFSQLELDQPQLKSNTRFAIFVPEKRPFFLEGTDLLSIVADTIYTRSITDPLWGARATYRSAALDATVLTVSDRGGGFVVLPNTYFSDFRDQGRSQATVARVRVPFSRAGTTGSYGMLLSDRTYKDDTSNRVAAVDGLYKPSEATRVRAQVVASQTRDNGRSSGHNVFVDALYDDGRLHVNPSYSEFSPGFRFDNTLTSQVGVRRAGAEFWYCTPYKDAFFNNVCPGLNVGERRAWDNTPLQRWITPNLFANGAKTSEWEMQYRYFNYRRVRESGKWHHTPQWYVSANGSPGGVVRSASVNVEFGRNIDVFSDTLTRGLLVNAVATFRPHERIEVEPSVSELRLRNLDDDRTRLTERTGQVTAIGYISARDTLRLIAQYTLSQRNPAAYAVPVLPRFETDALSLVYSHKRGLGREFDLGFSRSNERASGAPTRTTTEVFAKLSWAISL
jgi:Domain of unknown function (DUF5916)